MAGEIVHIEFPTANADRAERFWSGLFGWEFSDSGMPGGDYRIARTGDISGAGIYGSNMVPTGHPRYYFAADDIEAAIAKIRSLAGEAEEKQPVPGVGWFAACTDSEGNVFHIFQADSEAA
jgi:predicted enzyme related to lactoylglutathione lyase